MQISQLFGDVTRKNLCNLHRDSNLFKRNLVYFC